MPVDAQTKRLLLRWQALTKPEELQRCFLNWIRTVSELTHGEVVAIDGKTLRHSFDRATSKGAIHMVSA